MIRVLIPADFEFEFYREELKTLYEKSQTQICDTNSFEFVTKNTFFYAFINDSIYLLGKYAQPTNYAFSNESSLIGGIYYFVDEEGKLFLNGFANRKMHELNLECLRLSTTWFDCDIYAQAQNRMSALCLLRCGFERIGNKSVFIKKNLHFTY